MRSLIWPWLVLLLTLAFALSPLFSNGFAGFSKEQFPIVLDHWPAQPAGWAFSIWGVIYLWLVVSGLFGATQRPNAPSWHAARRFLSVSLLVGVFWISAANMSPLIATGMILVMALFAIFAVLRAGFEDKWWLSEPLGLYGGWLTAATGVAFAVVFSGYGLMTGQTAAFLFISLVLICALIVQTRRPQLVCYPASVSWALFGIVFSNFSYVHWPTAFLAAVGIVILLGRLLFFMAR